MVIIAYYLYINKVVRKKLADPPELTSRPQPQHIWYQDDRLGLLRGLGYVKIFKNAFRIQH